MRVDKAMAYSTQRHHVVGAFSSQRAVISVVEVFGFALADLTVFALIERFCAELPPVFILQIFIIFFVRPGIFVCGFQTSVFIAEYTKLLLRFSREALEMLVEPFKYHLSGRFIGIRFLAILLHGFSGVPVEDIVETPELRRRHGVSFDEAPVEITI